jgi:hypothetical protein
MLLQSQKHGTFLKESVKRKRFFSGFLRTNCVFAFSPVFPIQMYGSFVVIGCFWRRLGCRRYGKLQSFFSIGDCSQHIPSRGAAHDHREQLCRVLVMADADLSSCEFLPVRATPFTASCGLTSARFGRSRRIQGAIRVGPNGRDLKLPGNSDRTTKAKAGS